MPRTDALTDRPEMRPRMPGDRPSDGGAGAPVLELVAVGKRFRRGRRELEVLRSIDLVVGQGEFVAIMGASGSGKSTLLQLAGGLDTPSQGQVVLLGRSLSGLTDTELARLRLDRIGFVFQFANLIPTLTALENAAVPLLLADVGRRKALREAELLLEELGMSDRAQHLPEELSGGELQRVALARALVTRPALILADEPTASLDSLAADEVMDYLSHVPAESGQAVLMATHDARAAAYADRIVTLRHGRIGEEVRASSHLP